MIKLINDDCLKAMDNLISDGVTRCDPNEYR